MNTENYIQTNEGILLHFFFQSITFLKGHFFERILNKNSAALLKIKIYCCASIFHDMTQCLVFSIGMLPFLNELKCMSKQI